ncbi:MAG: YidC/Oxa1 family rane protein insertase, partial [Actinomycetota bacterium]|nr:YidC/Oxa1 family rane protein insertase [Actinomycetota bacterium]
MSADPLQSPIFFALFRVLANMADVAAGTRQGIGPLGKDVAAQANASTIFGAPSATFQHTITIVNSVTTTIPSSVNTKLVCVVMIVLMSASQFTSMRQLLMKNMPESA